MIDMATELMKLRTEMAELRLGLLAALVDKDAEIAGLRERIEELHVDLDDAIAGRMPAFDVGPPDTPQADNVITILREGRDTQ